MQSLFRAVLNRMQVSLRMHSSACSHIHTLSSNLVFCQTRYSMIALLMVSNTFVFVHTMSNAMHNELPVIEMLLKQAGYI